MTGVTKWSYSLRIVWPKGTHFYSLALTDRVFVIEYDRTQI